MRSAILWWALLPLPAVDTLALVQPQTQVDENAGGVDLLVARFGSGVGAVSAQVTITADGAVLDQDFQAPQPAVLAWADGDLQPKSIHLPILASPGHTPDRFLTLGLTGVVGAVADPSHGSVGLTIIDRDPNPGGRVVLLRDDPDGNVTVDDHAGVLSLPVTRAGGTSGPQAITFQLVDEDAQAGVDYAAPTVTTLHWAAGEGGTKSLLLPILPRTTARGTRTVAVLWSESTGDADIDGVGWEIHIADTLPALAGTFAVPTTVTAPETASTAEIPVARSGGTAGAVSLDWSLVEDDFGDTAVAGTNYAGPTSGTLSWADGDGTAKTISIPLLDDGVPTVPLSLQVVFASPTGGAILPRFAATTLTITDADHGGLVGFTATARTVTDDVGSVLLTVARQGGTTGAVSVDFSTTGGTAVAGTDFTAVSGTLTWADGDATTRTITLPVLDAPGIMPDRTVSLFLSHTQGGAGIDAHLGFTQITLRDHAAPAVDHIGLTAGTITVPRTAGSIALTFLRSGAGIGPAGVQLTLQPGTARQAVEYGLPSASTLTWADGETGVKVLTIPILDDGETGTTRSFTVFAGLVYGNAQLAGTTSAVVRIGDAPTPSDLPLSASPSGTCGTSALVALLVGAGLMLAGRQRPLPPQR